jgi:TPR repeat protein
MKMKRMARTPWVLAAYFLGLGLWFIQVPAARAQNETPAQWTQEGWSYWNGTGVDKDYSKAVGFFQKAAEQGDVGAEYGLGCAYDYGLGVDKDYSQAVKWYKKAADQGNSYGQFGLGGCYENGKGVPRDLEKAKHFYQLSADQKNDQGEKALRQLDHPISEDAQAICDKGWAAQQAGRKEEAFKYFKQSAELGNAAAQESLGWCFWNGVGTGKSYSQAVKWFQKSGDQGQVGAEYGLGCSYFFGLGAPKDPDKAFQWFKKCSDQGYSYGEYGLGLCSQAGAGAPLSLKDARYWFQLAADQGNEEAKKALAGLDNWNSFTSVPNHAEAGVNCYPGFPQGVRGKVLAVVTTNFTYEPEGDAEIVGNRFAISFENAIYGLAGDNPDGPQFVFIGKKPCDVLINIQFNSRGRNSKGEAKAYWTTVSCFDKWGPLFSFSTDAVEPGDEDFPYSMLDDAVKKWYGYIANGWTCD